MTVFSVDVCLHFCTEFVHSSFPQDLQNSKRSVAYAASLLNATVWQKSNNLVTIVYIDFTPSFQQNCTCIILSLYLDYTVLLSANFSPVFLTKLRHLK